MPKAMMGGIMREQMPVRKKRKMMMEKSEMPHSFETARKVSKKSKRRRKRANRN